MNKIERQFAEVRASGEDREVKFIFSTNAKDRHGTVINPGGWQLDNFNKNGIASFQHRAYGDPDPDMIIGKAQAWTSDDKLVGTIRFEEEEVNPLADKLYKKVKAGTLNAVSVGFLEKRGHFGDPDLGEEKGTYYFDEAELMEISLVTVPSNPEALAYRTFEKIETSDLVEVANNNLNNNKMAEEKVDGLNEMTHKVEVELKTEKFDEAVNKLTEAMEKKIENIPGPVGTQFSEQDNKDAEKFSFRKMIMNKANGKMDGIEAEMDAEGKKELRDAGVIPDEAAIAVPTMIHSRATLQATVDAAGGYAVAEDTLDLIGSLRNQFAVGRAGATILSGLQGDVKFPRRASDSAAAWRSEGGEATQGDPGYEALTMTPKRLTGYSVYSRQFLRQGSIDVENEVRDTLLYGHLNALETAVFTGSGSSNQPTGLFASSINDGDHGSNGTVLTWENIIQLERMVAEDNALVGNLAYITNATAAGKMKQTLKSTYQGGYIWEMFTPLTDGMINGYSAYVTNAVPNSLTRGTGTGLSAVVFGNWADLIIGQWGAIEFIVNPYSRDTYDEIRVTGVGYFDLGLRHVNSFAAIEGLETV